MSIITMALLAIVAIAVIIAVLAWFYEKSSREVALVRTGLGGRKVVLDGGVLVLPYFHRIDRVNMKTMRLAVTRRGEQSLITKDRLRVDVSAEFHVSVEPASESISRAAQTLGSRIFDPDQLRDLVEGKLVDTLMAVAAQMTMDELHEGRAEFAKQVKAGAQAGLARNGLELETVSLTALDQTAFAALDENNAFNAVGMRKLAEVVAKSRKDRAAIDADAEVAVKRSAMEAAKMTLTINLEEQEARLEQERQLENLRAGQLADIAAKKAAAEVAAGKSRIEMEQQIRNADISRVEAIRRAEIDQQLKIETAEQDRHIRIMKQKQDEAKVASATHMAKADAAKAEEAISTSRAVAGAERRKSLETINAEAAAAIRVVAADASAKEAKAQAEAEKHRLSVMAEELAVKAGGRKAFNEAENILSPEMAAVRRDEKRIKALPGIVRQMVKPAKKIDSIRISHLSGDAFGGRGGGKKTRGAKPPVNQALDSIMEMAVQLPALRKIGEDLGVNLDEGMTAMGGGGGKSRSKGGRK